MGSPRILSVSSIEPYKHRPPYPQVFRRTFGCGHPEEFIEAWRDNYGHIIHNLIAFEVFHAHIQAYPGGLEFEQARCLNCARDVKASDEDQCARPTKCLSTYQAGMSSKSMKRLGATPLGGLDGVFEKYKHRSSQGTYMAYHPPVSEEQHLAYYCEVKEEARNNKWVAIPAKRVWHAPLQNAGRIQLDLHQGFVSYLFENEDRQLHRSVIEAVLRSGYYGGNECAPSSAFLNEQKDGTLSNGSHRPHQDDCRDASNLTSPEYNFEYAEVFDGPLLPRISDRSFENPQIIAYHMDPAEDSEHVEESRQFVLNDLTTRGSDSYLFTHSSNRLLSGEQTLHLHIANPISSEGGSALAEHSTDKHTLPLDDSSNLLLADLEYECPRAAPSLPKKKPIDFMLRGGSALTRASSKSEPISRNFRKLRLDLQYSTKAANKTEPDSESPDWACQISLSIEAGKMSMDDVSTRSREPESSESVVQRIHTPQNIPAARKLAQNIGSEEWRNTYSSPLSGSSKYALAPLMIGRHSEGAHEVSRRTTRAH